MVDEPHLKACLPSFSEANFPTKLKIGNMLGKISCEINMENEFCLLHFLSKEQHLENNIIGNRKIT